MAAATCTGARGNVLFAPRCGAPAAWSTPSGPRCDACADRERDAIRAGTCLLAILSDARGVPRARLLGRYRRIE
jgi:hypothetical protein